MNPSNYKRNELGLIEGVQYQFNEDGSINWRAMIKPEFLYPNKEWFEVRKMPVPETVEGLADHQLLVKLGGIKELARLRGFNSVQYTLNTLTDKYATAICEICWMPNYETCGVAQVFASTANATSDNCSGFGVKFLEAIAENRAFVRAVRNYLNIHIVGDDEIDKSKNKAAYEESEAIVQTLTPHGALQNAARQAGYSNFEDFLGLLRQFWKEETYKNEAVKDWKTFDDIPVKECRKLLSLVNSCQSKK